MTIDLMTECKCGVHFRRKTFDFMPDGPTGKTIKKKITNCSKCIADFSEQAANFLSQFTFKEVNNHWEVVQKVFAIGGKQ